MIPSALLDTAKAAGVALHLVGGKLKAEGKPEHIEAIRPFIAQHRADIIKALAANDADLTHLIIATPHPGTADRRLSIASSAGQYKGAECGNCLHLAMTQGQPTPAHRRLFQWACTAGFKPLVAGYGSERVLVAPEDCDRNTTTKGFKP